MGKANVFEKMACLYYHWHLYPAVDHLQSFPVSSSALSVEDVLLAILQKEVRRFESNVKAPLMNTPQAPLIGTCSMEYPLTICGGFSIIFIPATLCI